MGSNRSWLFASVVLLLAACSGANAPPNPNPADVADAAPGPDDAGQAPLDRPPTATDHGSPANDRLAPAPDVAPGLDAGFDVGVATPDAGPVDTGPATVATLCDPSAVTDLDAVGTRVGATTSYTGSNASVASGAPLASGCFETESVSHERVLRYVPRTEARLRVSTDNPGTNFNTVVWVQDSCASLRVSARNLGCDNDSGTGSTSLLERTEALPAGVPVYIVVAGYGSRTDTGIFALTITEQPAVAAGGACDPTASSCGVGLRCVPGADPTAGTCIADGALGGFCRFFSELPCNAGLGCDYERYDEGARCRTAVPTGSECGSGTRAICPSAAPCNTARGRCLAFGALDGRCRATGDACDAGLGCDGYASSTTTHCRPLVAVGEVCDRNRYNNVCVAGSSCVYRPDAFTCVVDGTANGLCRITGAACDAGLRCYESATTTRCRTVLPLGATCSFGQYDPVCEEDASCRELPTGTRCVRFGTQGARCRTTEPACDGRLQCQVGRFESVCRAVLTEGQACDATGELTDCVGVWACSAVPGEAEGRCAYPGTAPGAECLRDGPRCAAGLSCSSETPVDGYCRRTLATPTAACDWTGRTTICPAPSGCVPTGSHSGVCTPAVEEIEPNNAQSNATPTAATGAVVHGTVEARGFDCVSVVVTEGVSIFAQVQLPDDPTCRFDNPVVQVYNPSFDLVTSASATSASTLGRSCPSLDPTQIREIRNRPPGRYVVCVLEASRAVLRNYLLTVGLVPTH